MDFPDLSDRSGGDPQLLQVNPRKLSIMDLSECKQILVFGGSFDPPHVGHIVLPMLAMEAIGADAVAYIPAANPPHKAGIVQTPAVHRLAMMESAVAGLPFAHVLPIELERAERGIVPNYTVGTLEELREKVGPGPRLRLLIGGDMLRSFDTWHQPERIVELAEPVVMVRPPDTIETLLAALPACFKRSEWEGRLVTLPQLDISSTMIRGRLAVDRPIRGLITESVDSYISKYCLFTSH